MIKMRSCYLESKHKNFPAYGKLLMKLRRAGKIPSQIVMIVFDWKVAQAYPRIVIPVEISIEKLEFSFLSGLPVQIAYHDKDTSRVDTVVREILKINPCFLSTFARDLVEIGKATTIIRPLQNNQIVMRYDE